MVDVLICSNMNSYSFLPFRRGLVPAYFVAAVLLGMCRSALPFVPVVLLFLFFFFFVPISFFPCVQLCCSSFYLVSGILRSAYFVIPFRSSVVSSSRLMGYRLFGLCDVL